MDELESLGLNANRWKFLGASRRYVDASRDSKRPLRPRPTERQFATAAEILVRLNGSNGNRAQKGLLLADDVGLGKTTVAALVAWIVARAGNLRVRILAPNVVMARRWASELELHVDLLHRCAPALGAEHRHIKRKTYALRQGQIHVATHGHAINGDALDCDLLIVDEAHRAKGKDSKFARALRRCAKKSKRLLILTATPFSIHIRELEGMLRLVGGESSLPAIRAYDSVLDQLYRQARLRAPEDLGKRLAIRARDAVEAIRPYVIRHAVDDLWRERRAVGDFRVLTSQQLPIERASAEVLEVLVRTDRVLRLSNRSGKRRRVQTNDPRFHVGWDELGAQLEELAAINHGEGAAAVEHHRKRAAALLRSQNEHPKARGVADWVSARVRQGEKVVVFCHHHATAREVARSIHARLRNWLSTEYSDEAAWHEAWIWLFYQMITEQEVLSRPDETFLRGIFLKWLSSPLVRGQIERWNGSPLVGSAAQLKRQLRSVRARGPGGESVPKAALNLYRLLIQKESRSTLGVLRAAEQDPGAMPGGGPDACAVQALCDPPDELEQGEETLFRQNEQPDTALAIFNSPFGPEVLVATDRLSEGIDLHSCCRTIIHYELDPSPIRTIQRNGRLRRINSWSAATRKPIECGYPAFAGTRDERLVEIMHGRIAAFSLLLGGAAEIRVEDEAWDDVDDEDWRRSVLENAKVRLVALPRRLTVRPLSRK